MISVIKVLVFSVSTLGLTYGQSTSFNKCLITKDSLKVDTIEGNFYIEASVHMPSLTLSLGKVVRFNPVDSLLYLDGIFINPIRTFLFNRLQVKGIKVDSTSLKELASLGKKMWYKSGSQDSNYERKYQYETFYKIHTKFEYVFAGYEEKELPYLFLKNSIPKNKGLYIRRRKIPIYLITKIIQFQTGFAPSSP